MSFKDELDSFPRKYYVVFRQGRHKFAKRFKPTFGHAWILYRDEFYWVKIEVFYGMIIPKILFPYTEVVDGKIEVCDLPTQLKQSNKVVEIECEIKKKEALFRFGIVSCVGIIKHILGIKNWFIFSPYGLYKYLLKHRNGKLV